MKTIFSFIVLIGVLMMAVNAKPSDTSTDLANLLKQYKSSENVEAIAENDDDSSDDEDALAKIMINEVMSSVAEPDEDGDGDMFALMMSEDDDKAKARFQFFRRIFRRVRRGIRRFGRSRLGRFVINRVRNRICRGKK